MTLEDEFGSLCQIQQVTIENCDYDLRKENSAKPFGVNYFRIPSELPSDWQSKMETGTSGGGIIQKDD